MKDNSDTEYTIYTPDLGKYSDTGQLSDWAVEAMGFMNTLGLISGTSGATLSPNKTCTIEQAIVVARRSLDAGSIGWYQFVKEGNDWLHYGDRLWVYFKNGEKKTTSNRQRATPHKDNNKTTVQRRTSGQQS